MPTMIAFICMLIIFFIVAVFFIRIRLYGDKTHFFVVGGFRLGMAGQIAAMVMCVLSVINDVQILIPVLLFLSCLIITLIYLPPLIKVNGDKVECVWFGGESSFVKPMAEIRSGKHGLHFKVDDKEFLVYRDSINYDRLVDWL